MRWCAGLVSMAGHGCPATIQEQVRLAIIDGIDPTDPIWKLTPSVDNPGSGDWGRYEFDWNESGASPETLVSSTRTSNSSLCLGQPTQGTTTF